MGTSSSTPFHKTSPSVRTCINPPLKMRAVIAVLVLVVVMATVTDLSYGAPNSPRMKRDNGYEECVHICTVTLLGCFKSIIVGPFCWAYYAICRDFCSP